jgi:hypothetical protein
MSRVVVDAMVTIDSRAYRYVIDTGTRETETMKASPMHINLACDGKVLCDATVDQTLLTQLTTVAQSILTHPALLASLHQVRPDEDLRGCVPPPAPQPTVATPCVGCGRL